MAKESLVETNRPLLRIESRQWARVVMDRGTGIRRVAERWSARRLEISATEDSPWAKSGFASYTIANYPEYDVCERPFAVDAFDLVIAQQVFEHVLWPYRAAKHVYEMLRPGACLS